MLKRQLISIVSAALLAVHVSVGCCAHHHHDSAGDAGFALAATHSHQHAADREICDPSAPQHDRQPGNHPCGEGHCTYLADNKVNVPDVASTVALAAVDARTLLSQVVGQTDSPAAPADSMAAPPVRSHLVKQVLLI